MRHKVWASALSLGDFLHLSTLYFSGSCFARFFGWFSTLFSTPHFQVGGSAGIRVAKRRARRVSRKELSRRFSSRPFGEPERESVRGVALFRAVIYLFEPDGGLTGLAGSWRVFRGGSL